MSPDAEATDDPERGRKRLQLWLLSIGLVGSVVSVIGFFVILGISAFGAIPPWTSIIGIIGLIASIGLISAGVMARNPEWLAVR